MAAEIKQGGNCVTRENNRYSDSGRPFCLTKENRSTLTALKARAVSSQSHTGGSGLCLNFDQKDQTQITAGKLSKKRKKKKRKEVSQQQGTDKDISKSQKITATSEACQQDSTHIKINQQLQQSSLAPSNSFWNSIVNWLKKICRYFAFKNDIKRSDEERPSIGGGEKMVTASKYHEEAIPERLGKANSHSQGQSRHGQQSKPKWCCLFSGCLGDSSGDDYSDLTDRKYTGSSFRYG